MTGFKFMHNHQTIDLLLPLFNFGTPSFQRLLFSFRMSLFEEVAASEASGFIFSCVSDFDSTLDRAQTECYITPFLRRGSRVLFVELTVSLETRLERNRSEGRRQHKPSKRDADFAETLLLQGENHRCDSDGDFPYPYPHLKIDNESLSPHDVAARVCNYFNLENVAS